MSDNSHNLDDILDRFMMENAEPSREMVNELIRAYPAFRDEILEFAVAWALDHAAPDAEPYTADEMNRIIDRNDSDIADYLYRRDEQPAAASVSKEPASASHLQRRTLKQLSETAGLALPELAARICLDISVVAKLNNCLVRPETIPERLFDLASGCLRASRDMVRISVCGPPRFSANGANLSKEKPIIAIQISFQEAVTSSQMEAPDKQKWLLETV